MCFLFQLLTRIALTCGWLFLPASAHAVKGKLVTVAGSSTSVDLVAVTATGVVFQPVENDGPQEILEWNELVRWSHPRLPSSQSQVLLTDGSLLVVADEWTKRGGTLRCDAKSLVVSSKLLGEIDIPRDRVAAILLKPNPTTSMWQRQLDQFRNNTAHSDHVFLKNGDLLMGGVTALDEKQLDLATNTGLISIDVDDVQAIAFDPGQLRSSERQTPCVAIGLTDGSLVYAKDIHASTSKLKVVTWSDIQLSGKAVGDVASLQTIRCPGFDYLSDLEPIDYRHIPYLNLQWELFEDRSVLAGPLISGGVVFLKGLGMHSASRAVYQLDGTHRRFETHIALDESAGTRGSVVFRIFLAKDDGWQEVFTSPIVRGGESPRPLSVDLSEAQAMTLVVDYADRGDELDHANWLDARLVR